MNDEIVAIDALNALDFIRIVVDEWLFFLTMLRVHQQIAFLELDNRLKMLESNVLLNNEHAVDSTLLIDSVKLLTYLSRL